MTMCLQNRYDLNISKNLFSNKNWSMFNPQLTHLKDIFQKNGYLKKFVGRWFNSCLNKIHILKEIDPTVEKKLLRLVFACVETISFQTRTKFQSP